MVVIQRLKSLESDRGPQDGVPASTSALMLLLALFVGSGCAALIYEIVWFQLLQLVIGSSAVSLGLLLGTFMGGMCLGSLLFPRFVSGQRHPLRMYALLELGIGLSGILVLIGVPVAGRVYVAFAGHGFGEILLRGLLASACLLPPAALMGATLPAIARWVETTPRGVSWLGFFYGGNTAGAVGGCLLAGFYLLRIYDMAMATGVAVAINVTVALVALMLARRIPYQSAAYNPQPEKATALRGAWAVYLTIALSGATALAAEVIWTRLFSLMLGGTTYTFSIILAAFLGGIGIGSSLGSRMLGRIVRPRLALGVCQWLLVAAIAWTAWMLSNTTKGVLPFSLTASPNPWANFAMDLARCAWAIVPAACLWGASFPLALAALAAPGQDGGRLVGRVYAANTVGSILGAVVSSLLLIPGIGTQQSQRLLMGIAAAAGLLMVAPLVWPFRHATGGNPAARLNRKGTLGLAAALLLSALLVYAVKAVPFELIAYGREAHWASEREFEELYRGEGINASIGVSQRKGIRHFHVSGKVEASSDLFDMRLQRMLANLPAILHPDPHAVLVVGFGAGVTAGAFLPYFDVRRLVICEIEPLVPRAIGPYFSRYNFDVLQEPTVELIYDDARHYILTTHEKFDVITSDPIHPYVKGAATLYTQEYLEEVRAHLNPGGFVTQWMPLYESNLDSVKTEIATFLQVFPNATAWCNMKGGEGYDLVLLGSVNPLKIDLDNVQERLGKYSYRFVAGALSEVGFKSATDLFATFAGEGHDLLPWLQNAEINRDGNLRLQYLAGILPAADLRGQNFREMRAVRKVPKDLFVGSAEHLEAMTKALETPPETPPKN